MHTSIKRKIDEFLLKNNMTLRALEIKAGVKPLLFRNLLNGRSKNPSLSTLLALSKYIGCTVDELLEDEVINEKFFSTNQPQKPSEAQDSTPTNFSLLKECFSALVAELANKNQTIPVKKVCLYLEEIYQFSLKKNLSKPDYDFMDWIISNY